MNSVNWGSVLGKAFQAIQILAIGFLIFKVLQPSGATEKLNKIEQNQAELKQLVDKVITSNEKAFAKYDSTNQVSIRKINVLSDNITVSISQAKATNKKIDNFRTIFEQNKVDLPDPDK